MTSIDALADRLAVEETLYELMHAVDQGDFDAAQAVLAEEVFLDYTALRPQTPAAKGRAGDVIAEWRERMGAMPAVHHHVGNVVVALAGDEAHSKASVIACHRRAGPTPDTYVLWHLGALYRHDYRRVEGRWRISSLVIHKLWDRTDTLCLAGGRDHG